MVYFAIALFFLVIGVLATILYPELGLLIFLAGLGLISLILITLGAVMLWVQFTRGD